MTSLDKQFCLMHLREASDRLHDVSNPPPELPEIATRLAFIIRQLHFTQAEQV